MIYKSYLLEKKIKNLKENVALFYGENFGLKQEFKNDIRFFYKDCEILNFYQDEILKDERALEREIKNISLFQKKKIFFLNNVSDKIFDILNQNFENVGVNKIYIFSDILDKKSKIRNFFEKEKNYACIPCYPDNEISIKISDYIDIIFINNKYIMIHIIKNAYIDNSIEALDNFMKELL